MNGRFLLNRREAKVLGVAAGIADYTAVDPLLIRLGLVALTMLTGPIVILFYLLIGWLAPQQ
jgi:phage shock protein C